MICATQQKKTGLALSMLSSKRLDLHYLRYPAKDWICAICAIQEKTGFALSALSSKRLDLHYQRYPAKDVTGATG